MKNEYCDLNEAILMMKAGCEMLSFSSGEKECFTLLSDKILIRSENKEIKINIYRFKELYAEARFLLSDHQSEEEVVDPKKDAEYYSWHQ